MSFYGLDFGTTNSTISILKDGRSYLFPIDDVAPDSVVVRSALYFYPRKFVIHTNVPRENVENHMFREDQFHYEGEYRNLIGSSAVKKYLDDNKMRHPGVNRRIYTGKIIRDIPLYTTPGGTQVVGSAPEYYEEIEYGTGRLFHALKTALKSPVFKGNRVFGNYYSLEQLVGLFISQMKDKADRILGEKINSVVCGRPRFFSTSPEKDKVAEDRLRNSLLIAGFENIKFEYEPVAAARSYLSKYEKNGQKVFIFDFGGGTLDTTIMERVGDDYFVIATDGVYIGGDLLNSDIFFHKLGPIFGTRLTWGDRGISLPTNIIDGLRSWYGIPNLNNPRDMGFLTNNIKYKNSDLPALERLLHLIRKNLGFELYEAIEKAKKELTYSERSNVVYRDDPININVEITRSEFEELIQPRTDEIRKTILRTLESAKLEAEQIDVVVRTGGSSLIPVYEKMLISIFGSSRVTEYDPFTSVASGLCLNVFK